MPRPIRRKPVRRAFTACRLVAHTEDRLDQPRAVELGAELRHVLVHGACAAGQLETPDLFQQTVAAGRHPGVLDEEGEEVELAGVSSTSSPATQASRAWRATATSPSSSISCAGRGSVRRRIASTRAAGSPRRAPPNRLDARRRLPGAERFGHVVAKAHPQHVVALIGQVVPHQTADAVLVFDEQDSGAHASPSGCRCGRDDSASVLLPAPRPQGIENHRGPHRRCHARPIHAPLPS